MKAEFSNGPAEETQRSADSRSSKFKDGARDMFF